MKPHTPAHAQSKVRVTQSALRPRPHTRTHRHARLTSVAVSDRKDPVCPSHSESTASFALWKTVAPFELFSHDVQHFSTQHQSGETLLFDGKKSYVFIASVHADILQTLQATRGTILSADLKYPFALFVLGESLRFFISWILFEHVPHLYPDACESCWNEVNKKKQQHSRALYTSLRDLRISIPQSMEIQIRWLFTFLQPVTRLDGYNRPRSSKREKGDETDRAPLRACDQIAVKHFKL